MSVYINKRSIRNIIPKKFPQSFSLSFVNPWIRKNPFLPRVINPDNNEIPMVSVAVVEAEIPRKSPGTKQRWFGDSSAKLRDGFRAEKLF